jgi:hypothetical protein
VANGNIGQIEGSDTRVLWNLASDATSDNVVERIAEWLECRAIPWFDGFGNPSQLRRRLFDEGVPLLDNVTALEWCLYEYGEGVAGDYLRNVILANDSLRDSVTRLLYRVDPDYLEGGPDATPALNIAALAATYGLSV